MQRKSRIHEQAQGRWREILPALGIHEGFLKPKHGPCPMCQGTDRWRWDNKDGRGTWFCSHCKSGNGIDLVMRFKGCSFAEACRMVEEVLPSTHVEMPTARREVDHSRIMRMWERALPLTGWDPVCRYLAKRGLKFGQWPAELRYIEKARYLHDDKSTTEHPAMIARFVSPDTKAATVHFTYLDVHGRKADVPKARKMAPGKIPPGGAVRLGPIAETMGIAEGIETALSASLIHRVPVWAGLSTNGLIKWEPPKGVKHVLVFGDADKSFAGQSKAFGLAYRLRQEGLGVDVMMPPEIGEDWNDVLVSELVTRKVDRPEEVHA